MQGVDQRKAVRNNDVNLVAGMNRNAGSWFKRRSGKICGWQLSDL